MNDVLFNDTIIDPELLPPKELIFPKGFRLVHFEDFLEVVTMELVQTGGYRQLYQLKCPRCGSSDLGERGSEKRVVKDIPYLGRRVIWELTVTEFQCQNGCGRESFVCDFPGFLERGAKMTVRLKEFLVLLAACTSAESASRIMQYMFTGISGDTIMRTVQEYKKEGKESVWQLAMKLRKSAISRCTDDQIEELGRSLAYYMEPEIMSIDAEVRLKAMESLFVDVFQKGRRAPEYKYTYKEPEKSWMKFNWKDRE